MLIADDLYYFWVNIRNIIPIWITRKKQPVNIIEFIVLRCLHMHVPTVCPQQIGALDIALFKNKAQT